VTGVLDAHRATPTLGVEAWDRSEQQRLAQGTLASLDNQIDTSTGTLRLKATFANDDGRLFPNQFVNVRLAVRTIAQAVVLPDASIQYGAQGNYVYVVKDAKVSIRPVKTGAAEGDRLVILEGLTAGEQVVLEGFERLREGATVRILGGSSASEADPT
jgi:multidrug efflux system membrane fusion protein